MSLPLSFLCIQQDQRIRKALQGSNLLKRSVLLLKSNLNMCHSFGRCSFCFCLKSIFNIFVTRFCSFCFCRLAFSTGAPVIKCNYTHSSYQHNQHCAKWAVDTLASFASKTISEKSLMLFGWKQDWYDNGVNQDPMVTKKVGLRPAAGDIQHHISSTMKPRSF